MTSGDVKILSRPVGGGVHVTNTKYTYTDGTSEVKQSWFKNRMVFPTIQIGDAPAFNKVFVASDQLGNEIAENLNLGDRVRLFTYGHLLRKQVIMGVKVEGGGQYVMPAGGYASGLLWYAVFSPIVVGIPAVIIGMLVGMLGGKKGSAMGLLFGVLYAIGISWYSGYRFHKTYREMRTELAKP